MTRTELDERLKTLAQDIVQSELGYDDVAPLIAALVTFVSTRKSWSKEQLESLCRTIALSQELSTLATMTVAVLLPDLVQAAEQCDCPNCRAKRGGAN